jgi:hypothetical protein
MVELNTAFVNALPLKVNPSHQKSCSRLQEEEKAAHARVTLNWTPLPVLCFKHQ